MWGCSGLSSVPAPLRGTCASRNFQHSLLVSEAHGEPLRGTGGHGAWVSQEVAGRVMLWTLGCIEQKAYSHVRTDRAIGASDPPPDLWFRDIRTTRKCRR